MSGITDREGNAFVDDLIERARSGNDSFYDYLWINPATGEIEPKHSLSIAIPEWDWMIGTGIYLSDIDEGLEAVEVQAWQEFKQEPMAERFGDSTTAYYCGRCHGTVGSSRTEPDTPCCCCHE